MSCTATKPNHVANSGRVQPEAYNRQQYLDHRGPSRLTTDQSSPLKDVRLKPDGVAINTLTF